MATQRFDSLVLRLVLLLAFAAGSARAEVTITRAELLERFRKVPGLYARFREEKRIALLVDPLVSEGTLHFVPPERLAKHVLQPAKSSVLIDGGVLRFRRGQTYLFSTAISSGFVWNSFLYLEYAYDARGVFRDVDADDGHSFMVIWSKSF